MEYQKQYYDQKQATRIIDVDVVSVSFLYGFHPLDELFDRVDRTVGGVGLETEVSGKKLWLIKILTKNFQTLTCHR